MQESGLGEAISLADGIEALRHGDLIFWKGHVGFYCENGECLHANATDMRVTTAPFNQVADRIRAAEGLEISAVKRITAK
mgnify:FL=1